MTKVEAGYAVEPHVHVEQETRHLEAPLLRLDLVQELADLRSSEQLRTRGHSAKTLAKYPELRVVLLAFEPGARLEEHQTKGRVTVHVVDGRVAIKIAGEVVELSAGCLLAIAPSVVHDVEAREQSGILLTVAWPAQTSPEGEP